MNIHPIYKVVAYNIEGPYTLKLRFNDGHEEVIVFRPVLAGELFGPLKDLKVFNQVRIDPEVHTLTWPNGADFDPATLHDWPRYKDAMISRVNAWNLATNASS
jgi:hypothetical protein